MNRWVCAGKYTTVDPYLRAESLPDFCTRAIVTPILLNFPVRNRTRRHPVVTPVLLHLSQCLSQCPVKSSIDLSAGKTSFSCAQMLNWVSQHVACTRVVLALLGQSGGGPVRNVAKKWCSRNASQSHLSISFAAGSTKCCLLPIVLLGVVLAGLFSCSLLLHCCLGANRVSPEVMVFLTSALAQFSPNTSIKVMA